MWKPSTRGFRSRGETGGPLESAPAVVAASGSYEARARAGKRTAQNSMPPAVKALGVRRPKAGSKTIVAKAAMTTAA